MNVYAKALEKHKEWRGKVEVVSKAAVKSAAELSLAYSPGVAEPCRQIAANPEVVWDYTWKGNTIAVVSDGSAVLGLGNIGPAAAPASHGGQSGSVQGVRRCGCNSPLLEHPGR